LKFKRDFERTDYSKELIAVRLAKPREISRLGRKRCQYCGALWAHGEKPFVSSNYSEGQILGFRKIFAAIVPLSGRRGSVLQSPLTTAAGLWALPLASTFIRLGQHVAFRRS